jgi:hypothetical protein
MVMKWEINKNISKTLYLLNSCIDSIIIGIKINGYGAIVVINLQLILNAYL